MARCDYEVVIVCTVTMIPESKMENPWIKYLNSPELVVKIQKFFGIKYRDKDDIDEFKAKSTSTSPSTSTDDERHKVSITNRFWYYLFVIGTELGDETFYACFIPFW